MVSALELTENLYQSRLSISDQVNAQSQALWQQFDPNELDASWDQLSGQLAMGVYNGQVAAATTTVPYMEAIGAVQAFQATPTLTDPRSYAGVAPDGRGLTPMLYGAVTTTKTATGAGWELARSFEAGAAFLASAVKTIIADAGRIHDGVQMNGRGYKQYIRAVSGNACSRCAMLAGTWSSAVAFPRHPNCQCVAVPTANRKKLDMPQFDNPEAYFDSLSSAEQDRIWTKAGARAIRDGADMNQVVNARRGAEGISFSGAIGRETAPNSGRRLEQIIIGRNNDGSPLKVYATTEGTTRRGWYGKMTRDDPSRRTKSLRLMPEQIYKMAGNNPERTRELLVRYGYIITP